jgi:hypothetical protein
MTPLQEFLIVAGITCAALQLGAWSIFFISKLGTAGRAITDALSRAPMLDLLVGYFTIAPLIVGPIVSGWIGLGGAVTGQVATVLIWTVLHSFTNLKAMRGPRIVKAINRMIEPWRNYSAVWITAIVVPLFWFVRLAELFVYPFLVWLVRFPKYKQGEWVNVSRQKFTGLVGHDLIWCLYCDWMTGVWSLGSEMLRNVESFWCPIRFKSDAKCENCQVDFPDIEGGWVESDATMSDVTAVIEEKYQDSPVYSWFGHPARLEISAKKKSVDSGENEAAAPIGTGSEGDSPPNDDDKTSD